MLIPAYETILMIEQDTIQEAVWTYFSIHFSGTIAVALIVVYLNNVTIGKVQCNLQIDDSLGFGELINFLKELEVVNFHEFVVA